MRKFISNFSTKSTNEFSMLKLTLENYLANVRDINITPMRKSEFPLLTVEIQQNGDIYEIFVDNRHHHFNFDDDVYQHMQEYIKIELNPRLYEMIEYTSMQIVDNNKFVFRFTEKKEHRLDVFA